MLLRTKRSAFKLDKAAAVAAAAAAAAQTPHGLRHDK